MLGRGRKAARSFHRAWLSVLVSDGTIRGVKKAYQVNYPGLKETAEKVYELWYDLLQQGGAYAEGELRSQVE
jgi:hypothetical protein